MKNFAKLLLALSLTPIHAEPIQRFNERDAIDEIEDYLSSRGLDPSRNELWSREMQAQKLQEVGGVVRRANNDDEDKHGNVSGVRTIKRPNGETWYMVLRCLTILKTESGAETHNLNCPGLGPEVLERHGREWDQIHPKVSETEIACGLCSRKPFKYNEMKDAVKSYNQHVHTTHGKPTLTFSAVKSSLVRQGEQSH